MKNKKLDREEYIEQAYFFRTYRERLVANVPSQEILETLMVEVLSTTKLPMALDFLHGELLLTGRIGDGMSRLDHYFTPFQTFVMNRAEDDAARFDLTTGLLILERLAEYLSGTPTPAGLFIYMFECISRNRLGYDHSLLAMADDPHFDDEWSTWISQIRFQLGTADFSDLIYYRSAFYVEQRERLAGKLPPVTHTILFDSPEGRIARANRGKDPLFMFAALQRQLDYPKVPRPVRKPTEPIFHPALEERLKRIEKQLKIIESEVHDDFDLSQFYKNGEEGDLPSP